MKKITIRIIQATLLSSVLLFSSCNKRDIESLEAQLAALEAAQAEQDAANAEHLEPLEDFKTPMWGTATGNRRDDSVAFSFSYKYSYSWEDYYGEYTSFDDNGDGTYDVFVQRVNYIEGDGYTQFTIYDYDPASPSTSEIFAYCEFYEYQSDINAVLEFDQDGYINDPYGWGNPDNMVINSIDLDFDGGNSTIDLTITDTEAQEDNSTNNASTVTLKWQGQLIGNDGSTISKVAKK